MRKIMKVFSVMMLVVLMTAMMITPAFAANSTVTYVGGEANFSFAPGSEYTDTDLFQNAKGMWPGDSVSETIDVLNDCDESHYINLYLQAESHSGANPPVAEEAAELALMKEFLQAAEITVKNGDSVVYAGSGDMAAEMSDRIFLGKYHKGEGGTLNVTITLPLDLDNKFAGVVSELDWVFVAEQMNYAPKTLTVEKYWRGAAESYPSSVTMILLQDGKEVEQVTLSASNYWKHTWEDLYGNSEWTIQEVVPNGYINSIKTSTDGDKITVAVTNTAALIQTGQLNWPVPVLLMLGVMLMLAGTVMMKKGRAHE